MRQFVLICLAASLLGLSSSVSASTQQPEPSYQLALIPPACNPLLNLNLKDIDGQTRNLCAYSGKVLLVVNTASLCGYTPQYKELEDLYRRYQKRGLVILGFPANQFGKQEPSSNQEIKKFCSDNYAVSFPLFAKSEVRGKAANPLYQQLIKKTGKQPLWNFHKFLVDRSGKQVLSFESSVKPNDPKLIAALEKMLKP